MGTRTVSYWLKVARPFELALNPLSLVSAIKSVPNCEKPWGLSREKSRVFETRLLGATPVRNRSPLSPVRIAAPACPDTATRASATSALILSRSFIVFLLYKESWADPASSPFNDPLGHFGA